MSDEPVDPYARAEQMKSGTQAERLAAAIWADVTDRRGWRQAADQFDNDVKHEILDCWIAVAVAHGVSDQ